MGEWRYASIMQASGQLHASAALPAGKRDPGTYWTGGWVAPQPVWTLWSREKSLTPSGNRTPADHYTA
jgi:hypothetical protein